MTRITLLRLPYSPISVHDTIDFCDKSFRLPAGSAVFADLRMLELNMISP